jgi:UDP-hydrolysing UDP-N-acetyl-D-glucosamine 2-epimerase
MIVEGETPATMAKSTGLGLLEFPTMFEHLKPDVVVSVGDRFETIATAIAAAYMNIPVAHTMGGEISGTIDESIRHAVTKLSHLHFPANQQAADRILRMGENPAAVHVVGCPRVDVVAEIVRTDGHLRSHDWLEREGSGAHITLDQPFLLVSQHPVTTEYGCGEQQITETLLALHELQMPPSSCGRMPTRGRRTSRAGCGSFVRSTALNTCGSTRTSRSKRTVRLMIGCACAVGNSSAPLREGAYIGVPTVNVGTRQQGRDRAPNVMDVACDRAAIVAAIRRQIAHGRYESDHLYGDGGAGNRIADILAEAPLTVRSAWPTDGVICGSRVDSCARRLERDSQQEPGAALRSPAPRIHGGRRAREYSADSYGRQHQRPRYCRGCAGPRS